MCKVMQLEANGYLTDLDDDALMECYRRGRDVSALDALVQRHSVALLRYLRGMFNASADVEDAFQEVWLRIIRRPEAYRNRNFKGWLLRIAHNVSIDRYRRQRSHVSLDAEPADGEGSSLNDRIPARGAPPWQGAVTHDELTRVAVCVRALPAAQREVFLMRVGADLSFKEIAAALRIPLNTALGRMHYAVNRLRTALSETAADHTTGGSHED